MIFLFLRWDMSVPWRVIPPHLPLSCDSSYRFIRKKGSILTSGCETAPWRRRVWPSFGNWPCVLVSAVESWEMIPQLSRWWFRTLFIFTPTWGNDPIWLIFFKLVVQPPIRFATCFHSSEDVLLSETCGEIFSKLTDGLKLVGSTDHL